MSNRRIRRGEPISAREINRIPGKTLNNIDMTNGFQTLRDGDRLTISGSGRPRQQGYPLVAKLPPIPASGHQYVIWGTSEQITNGTGDGHVWFTHYLETQWFPLVCYTSLSGAVEVEET